MNERNEAKNEKINIKNQWVGRLGSETRIKTSKNDIVREVWKSVAASRIIYGMDVLAWNEREVQQLEVGQTG